MSVLVFRLPEEVAFLDEKDNQMKKILAILLLSAMAPLGAADYQIDETHTNARFAIDHNKTSTNVGGFFGLSGMMSFDKAAKEGSIHITLPMSKLHTGSEHFTTHLKSSDIFDAERYPEIKFISTKFHFKGDKVRAVDGMLSMHGQTHPVRLKATKFNCYQSNMTKTEMCGGDFSVVLDRSKWGVNYLIDAGFPKEVLIKIQVEAAKK